MSPARSPHKFNPTKMLNAFPAAVRFHTASDSSRSVCRPGFIQFDRPGPGPRLCNKIYINTPAGIRKLWRDSDHAIVSRASVCTHVWNARGACAAGNQGFYNTRGVVSSMSFVFEMREIDGFPDAFRNGGLLIYGGVSPQRLICSLTKCIH